MNDFDLLTHLHPALLMTRLEGKKMGDEKEMQWA
jgi:hypothetical protein